MAYSISTGKLERDCLTNEAERRNDFALQVPYAAGLIVTRSLDKTFLGINDLQQINEGRVRNGIVAYSLLQQLKAEKTKRSYEETKAQFNAVKTDLGFGLLLKCHTDNVVDATEEQIKSSQVRDTIPYVGPTFWSFRIMMLAGGIIFLMLIAAFVQNA